MPNFDNITIMHWCPSLPHHCGYCNSSKGSISHGLWAECLRVDDYQTMIDRGWRRSGHYCYKPIMHETCCPQYTIRCDALEIQLTKSQKKVLKKFNKSLCEDVRKAEPNQLPDKQGDPVPSCEMHQPPMPSKVTEVRQGLGADVSLPICKKAKVVRRAKLVKKARSEEVGSKNNAKSFQDFLDPPLNAKHKFKIKLVKLNSDEYKQTANQEFNLYKKYQMSIHHDEEQKLSKKDFERFLVDSPLNYEDMYGSFHQQYWLNDQLIAVGVIDILPACVSSVYFFYDPDLKYLSLGTYSSLREVHFVQELHQQNPLICYYYMGFYIHTCPKMHYKAKLQPSSLLCPETYNWVKITPSVLSKLDANKYSRLYSEDSSATSEIAENSDASASTKEPKLTEDTKLLRLALNQMKMIVDHTIITMGDYLLQDRGNNAKKHKDIIELLPNILGKDLMESIYLVDLD